MFDSLTGLVVAFILLATVTAWNTVRTKGWVGLKFVSIGILIWYGFVVYFTIPQIMGWPTEKDLPSNSKIVAVRIVEPRGENKGSMFFWISQKPDHKKDAMNLLRPDKFLLYTGSTQPRSYRIPYDRELHKKLLEARKKQQGQKGSSLMTGKKGVRVKQKEEGNNSPTENPFKILNPFTFLKKEGGGQ